MAFGTAGTYAQVSGAVTAAAGQVLQSAVWNNIHTDLGNALTALGTCAVTPPTPRNILAANGGFEVWQRGAGGAASIAVAANTTAYTADRWYLTTGVAAGSAFIVSQQTGLNPASQWCAQVSRNSGQTGTDGVLFAIPIDTDEVIRMRGKKVSLTFTLATGALWSGAAGGITAALYVGTGAPAKGGYLASNFTNAATVLSVGLTPSQGSAATAYGGISASTVPTTATQAELQFTWSPTSTAGATDYVRIDDVMLDSSPAPAQGFLTQYERLPFDMMLRMCRRHFWKTFAYGTAPVQNAGAHTGELLVQATRAGATGDYIPWRNPAPMRTTSPTMTTYNPAAANAEVRDESMSADCSSSAGNAMTEDCGYVSTTGAVATIVGSLLGVHLTVDAGI